MRIRGKRLPAVALVVSALMAVPAPAEETAVTLWHDLRGAKATASWGAVSLEIGSSAGDGLRVVSGATPEPVSFATVCVKVRDRARRRFEHGCGAVPLTIDAATGAAIVEGRVPTNVLVLNQYKIVALSSVTLKAEFTGTGEWRPGPVFVPAMSEGRVMWPVSGVWRPAATKVSFRSAVLGAYFSRTTSQSSFAKNAGVVTCVAGSVCAAG